MVVWSSPVLRSRLVPQLRRGFELPPDFSNVLKLRDVNRIQVRTCKGQSGHFNIVPSAFSWNKTKDILKFHFTLVSLPFVAVILYSNIFIGPATLKPIPEGYTPKHWEYHRHPISRFFCRYLIENPQKSYEKLCYYWFYTMEKNLLRDLEYKVKYLIALRRDFQAWYYTPGFVKYTKNRVKRMQEAIEKDPPTGFPLY